MQLPAVSTGGESHGAAASALGYLYQSQWPLVELLRRGRDEPDSGLSLELHDDVAWEEGGEPTELLQLKHHVNAAGRLGDRDDDLWRTIRVWMDAHAPGDPAGPTLTLVTTGTAASGSAAAALRPGPSRDATEGCRLLEAAASGSTAEATRDVRGRFLDLRHEDRDVFVDRIYVVDAAAAIGDPLEEQLRRALYLVLPKGHEQTFIDQLWGWWHRVAVALLRRTRGTVTALDVKAKVDQLRDSFAGDNLPTLVRREDVDFDVEDTYADRPFVEQLRWIALTAKLLQKAMLDYYRAYAQSALWVEDNLVALDELQAFEADLVDEWERQFEFMRMKLPDSPDPAGQERAGQELFRLVSENSSVRLRAYDEPFYTHGTLHGLADDGRVGWHPEFQSRLEELLLGGAT